MGKPKTAREMFYFVEDVMEMLGYSRSKSFGIIAALNKELEENGIYTCAGRVNKKYFNRRFGLEEPGPAPKVGRRVSA